MVGLYVLLVSSMLAEVNLIYMLMLREESLLRPLIEIIYIIERNARRIHSVDGF